jgi:hypothetical protein
MFIQRWCVVGLSALLMAIPAQAATVFSEDFTDNANDTVVNANDDFQLMSQFSVASTGNNANWHIFDFSSDLFARVNGFGADVASDDWLFTPALNLTGATTAALTFESAYNFTGPVIELKVSTNYNPSVNANPSSATWTNLTFTAPSTGSYTWQASGSVDLTPYISATTYVAWRYTSTGTGSGQSSVWEVDDVLVVTDAAPAEGEGEGLIEGEGVVEGEVESIGEGGLIISEYLEGASNNKAVEIFNGKTTAENLNGYTLELYSNGSPDFTVAIDLDLILPSLPARGTLVIANSSANAAILAAADSTCAFPDCPLTFNGNDVIALFKDGDPVDVVGVIGEDPGTSWTSAGNSTQNQTLRRKAAVCFGNPDGFTPLSTLGIEWNTFAQDTTSGLGSHAIDCTSVLEGELEGEGEGVTEGEPTPPCDNEVFSEDFESNFNSTTDNNDDDFEDMTRVSVASTGNDANWHIFAADTQFARINGFGADVASDDWLITPAMNLTSFEDATLTFDSAYNFNGPALECKVSTNYNPSVHTNPASATWTNLSVTLPSVGGYVFASSGAVSLGNNLGASTYVAFRYTSTGIAGGEGRVWEVDNIAVCGVPEGPGEPLDYAYVLGELGGEICMEVPRQGTAGNGDFAWTFTPDEGGAATPIVGETNGELCLTDLLYDQTGAYVATFDDGAKAARTFTFNLTVVESLPAAGLLAMSAAAAIVACAGALGLRRRARN